MKIFLIKVKNLIKLILGFIPAITILLYKKFFYKKIIIVSLFSSKFGHFYSNTENFLRKNYSKKAFFIFYPEEIVDNNYLLKEWKKKIFIVPNFIGFSLFKLSTILNVKFYNCREYSAIDRKSFLGKGFLVKKRKFNVNYFTCSIRTSLYHKKFQVKFNNYQEYRDTDLKNFKLTISKFLNKKKNFQATLINSNAEKLFQNNINKINFKLNRSKKFEDILNLISNSNFHFGASTGVDTIAFSHNTPTALFNMVLGSSFNFINYPSKCIVSPMLLIEKKSEKVFKLKKYIKLIKFMENNYQKDRFDYEDQVKFKVDYKSNSEDEMYNLLNEVYLLSKGMLKLTNKEKKLQNKFWSIYPIVQRDVLTKQILSDQKKFKPIISPYFLNKHEKFLF